MIEYSDTLDGLTAPDLEGFLEHWDFTPPEGALLAMLQNSALVVLARDSASSRVCGYATALSDGLVCGYISALEVRPEFRNRGIGSALLSRIAGRLDVFGVYLSCAPTMVAFYESRGFKPVAALCKRKRP